MKFYTGVLSIAVMLTACACGNDYYTIEDFAGVKKIDTHVHLNAESTALAELAKEDNFRLITVNVDVPRETLADQKKFALHQISQYPDQVDFLTAFTLLLTVGVTTHTACSNKSDRAADGPVFSDPAMG